MSDILVAIIGALAIIIPAYLLHLRETRKSKKEAERLTEENEKLKKEAEEKDKIITEHEALIENLRKLEKDYKIKETCLDKMLDLSSYNIIKEAVDRIFEETKADRFLILIAVNGQEDFNVVSVILEQHKTKLHKINAIVRYRNIRIDQYYRDMLKLAERTETVHIDVKSLPTCLLKDFYVQEGVVYSKIRHLVRQKIDKENDLLVYSSLATHVAKDFTRLEKAFIKTQYEGTIIPTIKKVLE